MKHRQNISNHTSSKLDANGEMTAHILLDLCGGGKAKLKN
jgi:hypothetical protein